MIATLVDALAAAAARPSRPLPSVGTRTRVALTGTADTAAAVHASLTRAWRLIGQPIIVVVPPAWGLVERAAADWAAEHSLPGCGIEVRHGGDTGGQIVVAIDAGRPAPYCGCVHPPCVRCLEEPPRCAGCSSPLCPDCAGAR